VANTGLETEAFFSCLLPGERLCLPGVGSVQRILSNRHTQPPKRVTPHAQRIRDDPESRVHRSAGGEEAAVHDVRRGRVPLSKGGVWA
jgi:hypothetical protein